MESNTQSIPHEQLSQLISAVDRTFGLSPQTPKDFDLLRLSIYERTATLLSPTTLKRLWGYLNENVAPRQHTLDTLCRYAGWRDYNAMKNSAPTPESGPLALERINISNRELQKGDLLTITWLPDRKIVVEYLSDDRFEILSADNTRLQPGDTFTTAIIAQNQPLYLDSLTREGSDLGVYVCGRISGIRFILASQKD